MHHLNVFIIGICFGLIVSCSNSIFSNSNEPEESRELAQKAIFEYLNLPNFFLDQLSGKGLTKLDPLLCKRDTLSINGKVYFDKPMRSNLLKYPLPQKTYQLVIPDSLVGKFRYVDEKDKDYEHDYAIIHQFSSLLPTTEPNIYLMERYTWGNACHETGCVRLLSKGYLKFKIEGQKVTYLDDELLYNQVDFIGFGSFSRKKMEEALPGEKIVRFGH